MFPCHLSSHDLTKVFSLFFVFSCSTERESRRREDLMNGLRRRGEELVALLSKNKTSGGASGSRDTQMRMMEQGEPAKETEQTAELDNRSILQLQRNFMQGECGRTTTIESCHRVSNKTS